MEGITHSASQRLLRARSGESPRHQPHQLSIHSPGRIFPRMNRPLPTSLAFSSCSSASNSASASPHLLRALPAEIAALIAAKLSPAALWPLRGADRACAELALAQLWRQPRLAVPGCPKDAAVLLQMLNRYGHLVRYLQFADPTPIELRLLSNLPLLQSLDLSGITPFMVGDEQLVYLLDLAPSLTAISLTDCIDITDMGMLALARYPNVSRIVKLQLDRCCELTDASMVTLVRHLKSVKHLSLNLVPLITTLTMRAIASTCHLLEYLGLSDNDCATGEVLGWLAAGCPSLSSLDISECKMVTEEGLELFGTIRSCGGSTQIAAPAVRIEKRSSMCLMNLTGIQSISFKSLLSLLPGFESLSYCNLSSLALSQVSITPDVFNHISALYSNHLRYLDLSQTTLLYNQATLTLSSDAPLLGLIASQRNLVSLKLSGGLDGAVNDQVCLKIASTLVALENLDLSECPNITDAGVSAISSACRLLSDVNLKGNAVIGDKAVAPLVDSVSNSPLQSLNVGLCQNISDDAGVSLARLCGTMSKGGSGMHTLKFSGCVNISSATLDAISSTHCASTLQLLCLSGCYKLTTDSIMNLMPKLPHLQSLNLYSCRSVSDTVLEQIAACCPRISSLVVSKCPVGDRGVIAISKFAGLHTAHLGFLTLSGKDRLTDRGIRAIIDSCDGLKLLDVSRCEGLTDAVFCPLRGDEDAMDVDGESGDGKRCGRRLALQVLLLRCCPGITASALELFVVSRCPRMQSLDVMGCSRIDVRGRDRLRQIVDSI